LNLFSVSSETPGIIKTPGVFSFIQIAYSTV